MGRIYDIKISGATSDFSQVPQYVTLVLNNLTNYCRNAKSLRLESCLLDLRFGCATSDLVEVAQARLYHYRLLIVYSAGTVRHSTHSH